MSAAVLWGGALLATSVACLDGLGLQPEQAVTDDDAYRVIACNARHLLNLIDERGEEVPGTGDLRRAVERAGQ